MAGKGFATPSLDIPMPSIAAAYRTYDERLASHHQIHSFRIGNEHRLGFPIAASAKGDALTAQSMRVVVF